MRFKEILKIVWLPVVAATLCCLSPLVLFLLGLSTAAFTASLSDTLYYEYGWWFRGFGLILLIVALVIYFRKRGVCDLKTAKKRQKEIIKTVLIAFLTFVIGYAIFLGVIVEYIGVWTGVWDSYWADKF